MIKRGSNLFVILCITLFSIGMVAFFSWGFQEGFGSSSPSTPVKVPGFVEAISDPIADPDDFMIYEFDDFLTPEECQSLMETASKKLKPSLVYNEESDKQDPNYRISDQAWFKNSKHPVVIKIDEAVSKMCGLPPEHFEELQVVRYKPGGYFRPHFDACEGDEEFCARMNQDGGPRLWTFMVYLTDDYTGGRTVFTKLKRTIEPKQGKLIVFQNTRLGSEDIIQVSHHGGKKVETGEKWICNKWVRHRPYH